MIIFFSSYKLKCVRFAHDFLTEMWLTLSDHIVQRQINRLRSVNVDVPISEYEPSSSSSSASKNLNSIGISHVSWKFATLIQNITHTPFDRGCACVCARANVLNILLCHEHYQNEETLTTWHRIRTLTMCHPSGKISMILVSHLPRTQHIICTSTSIYDTNNNESW